MGEVGWYGARCGTGRCLRPLFASWAGGSTLEPAAWRTTGLARGSKPPLLPRETFFGPELATTKRSKSFTSRVLKGLDALLFDLIEEILEKQ